MTPAQFDEMTPRQLQRMAHSRSKALERKQREMQLLAYNTAVCTVDFFARALAKNSIPDFSECFSSPDEGDEMSDEEIWREIEKLNRLFGGEDVSQ